MKPLLLEVSAFGPFPGEEWVDFRVLGEDPLFLIHGPTGAGKSSLLDAMTYALYGKTTGDRTGEQMRCQHAAGDTETRVRFWFSLGEKIYQVERQPTQQRPKKRGSGFTEDKSRGALWEVQATPGDELVGAPTRLLSERKTSELDQHVTSLIGLNQRQFCQVVILPQGRFRELLTAPSREREEIFANLFDTWRFQELEAGLSERAKAVRQERARVQQNMSEILQESGQPSVTALREALSASQEPLAAARQQWEQARAEYTRAEREQARGEELLRQFQRLRENAAVVARLEAEVPAQRQRERRLALLTEAGQLRPDWQAWQDASQQRRNLQQSLRTTQAELAELQAELQQAHEELSQAERAAEQRPELRRALEQFRQQLSQLEQWHQLTQQLSQVNEEQARTQQQNQQQERRRVELLAAEQQLQEEQTKLQQWLRAAGEPQAALEQAERVQSDYQSWWQEQEELTGLQQQVERAEKAVAEARSAWQQRLQEERQLLLRWHQQQAVLLANELAPGEPCPVCGSTAHPKLAQAAANEVTEQALQEASQATEESRQHYQDLDTRYQGSRHRLTDRKQALELRQQKLPGHGQYTATELAAQVTQKQAALQQYLDQQVALEQLAGRLTAWQRQWQQLQDEWQGTERQLAQLETRFEELTKQQQALQAELGEQPPSVAEVQQQQRQTEQQLKRLEQALTQAQERAAACANRGSAQESRSETLQEQLQQARQEEAERAQRWQEALSASQFHSVSELEPYWQEQATVAELSATVQSWQRQWDQMVYEQEQLTRQLADQQEPEPAALAAQVRAAAEHEQQQQAYLAQQQQVADQLQHGVARIAAREAEATELEQQYQVLGTLAEAVTGQNDQRISLHRYVLSMLLDDVLAEASGRLNTMTNGRYQLERATEATDRRQQSGLELWVSDTYTGQQRAAETLSGGESFQAALALALGLSDVVQSYAGGIRLQTLFIDEGFGTLDEEALDKAVAVLAQLRQHGRTVGVISHVRELKDRLLEQVQIKRSRVGSQVAVQTSLASESLASPSKR